MVLDYPLPRVIINHCMAHNAPRFLIFVLIQYVAITALAIGDDCPGDLNGDHVVNGGDLGILLADWGSCSGCSGDVDQNGEVDGSDLGLLLALWDVTGSSCPSPSSSRFIKKPIGTLYENQGFWEYLPQGYESRAKWPLLIFYHGLGENGDGSSDGLDGIPGNGIPGLLQNDSWPVTQSAVGDEFVILCPQNSTPNCHDPDEIDEFLRWSIQHYNIDESRVYMTGLSCGAVGIWRYLLVHFDDELVAAAVPICGDGQLTYIVQGCELGKLPIWGFHGDADDVIDPQGTIYPIEQLQACTNPEAVDARLTLYSGVGHDSWTQTYTLSAGFDIYSWLLSKTNPQP